MTETRKQASARDKVAEPFRSVIKMMEPLTIPDDRPLARVLPGVWPTWGEFKRLMEAFDGKQ